MKILKKKFNVKRGFTLIEILVAMAVTAILATSMIYILSSTMNVWARTTGVLSADGQARTALESIAQDFESALVRDNGIWLAVNASGAAPLAVSSSDKAPLMDEYSFGSNGAWVRFFTRINGSGGGGLSAPRAVSYKIYKRNGAYGLYRSELDSESTFNFGYDVTVSNYENLEMFTDPKAEDLIANNVIDFGVRILSGIASAKGSNARMSDILFPNTNNQVHFLAPINGRPVYIDLYIKVLSDEGMKLLKVQTQTGLSSDDIIRQYSYIYTKRAMLKSEIF